MSPSLAATIDPTSLASDPTSSPFIDPRGEAPIRAELFGVDRLEALARRLASAAVVEPESKAGDLLLGRFAENGQVLVRTHRRIVGEIDRPEGRGIDADWLADNFHIVEEVLREIKQDLPSGYYSELPKVAVGHVRGYPRVYTLALALVAHTDSELDEPRITRFLEAFQSVAPLTIGELWAVPTMLRLVLVENLRRLAERMVRSWDESLLADVWVHERFPAAVDANGDAEPLPEPNDAVSPFPTLTDPTIVRLVRLLRDRGPSAGSTLTRLESQLADRGNNAGQVLREEHRRQAANQVSVGNCVISLRLLSVIDWNVFFEQNSSVEVLLRSEPSGVYALQDFATRDRYRRVIEKVARRSKVIEEVVARKVIDLATEGMSASPAKGHIGYYLIDKGRPALNRYFSYKAPWRERLFDFVVGHPTLTYFGSIGLLMLGLIAPLVAFGAGSAVGIGLLVLLVLALILPASDIAVGLVNHIVTLLMPPRKLARLDFKEGIPADCATFVVVPSMLVGRDSASNLLERLEITYLANPDPRLRFALLTDFADAPEEHRPEDDVYILKALDGVRALNERYAGAGLDRFFLFHRRRSWNPVQGCWMGWERKRGKLSEFNRLLRGDRDTNYVIQSAEPASLPRIRFVITLDADTILPRESARRLVGTLAHPLNAPRFDPAKRRVVEGHGVLQPRVSYHLFAATRSRFAGLLASSAGIDPYSNAVSDIYMDLFDSGSFTGKGIYDVDAFEAAVGHTFPDNQILSHDLIEGNYARCGLVTDVELFDDFPPRYHAYALREHRWARGDWQLLPWLGRSVPTPDGSKPNPLPILERWKIFDNLRRSLVPPSLVLLLVLGWTVLPGSPWLWTGFALLVPALPIVQLILGAFVGAIRSGSPGAILGIGHYFPATAGQALLWIAFLADQARRLIDAIVRTLNRLFVSHRRLLEWETAAATERRLGTGVANFFRTMWPSPAWAVAIGVLVGFVRPLALPAAAPVLLAWFVAPIVAFWVSRPGRATESPLTQVERAELRRIARKTWHFFETFVGEEDHWLPPDNYQEDSIGSGGRVAHRTSPTNEGMLLLSTLAAHDFGYLALKTLLDRLEKTFDTFDRMEKHEGHFYNWYSTQTLRTLPPPYVSTVDSGNLLGCLVTLKQGMREKRAEVYPNPSVLDGMTDTLAMLAVDVKTYRPAKAGEEYKAFDDGVRSLQAKLSEIPANLEAWDVKLRHCEIDGKQLLDLVRGLKGVGPNVLERWESYALRFQSLASERLQEFEAIVPGGAWLRSTENQGIRNVLPNSDELKAAWESIRAKLDQPAKLAELSSRAQAALRDLEAIEKLLPEYEHHEFALSALRKDADRIRSSIGVIDGLRDRCERLGERADLLGNGMDFKFLYKDDRHLFSIGQNMTVGRLDASCYDLMASEACLSSFLAVCRGDAPRRHWFQLGRPFIEAADRVGLLSWGGSMFEYLMPRLMLRPLEGTLLDEAHRTAVARQMEYGRQKGVPWGISESAYAAFTVDGDYHYQSFGTPGLGLKRDIGNDLVITPYATALAVAVYPREALENFKKLAAEGGEGRYGFHEAVDFSKERVPKGKRSVVVRSYMAHHHGMSLVALANALLDEPMPRRFHAEPMVRAAELLLQERVPRDAPIIEPSESEPPSTSESKMERATVPLMSRRLSTPATPFPRTHLLSNTQYNVMLTNAGSGYSTCRGLDVTRWREDATRDSSGLYIYIKDVGSDLLWSSGYQPTCRTAEHYEAIFSADKVAFRRLDSGIESVTEITVSPESRAEIRRVTLTNHDTRVRELELTSYAEVVLMGHGGDVTHPAFGKLFLETEWVENSEALICRRRPRSTEQLPIYAVHVAASDNPLAFPTQFETDRARFLGRGRSPADPAAMDPGVILSGTSGAVLDPVFSLRRRVRIEPGASAIVAFTTAVADSREEALTLADHYRETSAVARAFELAWAHTQVEHRHRNWSAQDAHLFQRLASHVLYAGSTLRADTAVLAENRKGQPGLWPYGISGDKPIVVAFIADFDELVLASQLLVAHTYLRLKGLDLDLVILGGPASGEFDELHQHLLDLVKGSDARDLVDKPGGIFVRKLGLLPEEDKILIQSYGRVLLYGDQGTLAGQLDRIEQVRNLPEAFVPSIAPSDHEEVEPVKTQELLFNNGFGGFSPDGLEYRITIPGTPRPDVRRNGKADRQNLPRPVLPPAPWVNVVANPAFGFIASEAGSGYCWAGNSQTNRLTPWSNDPVSDPPGEAVYVRDEETGDFWSPTPLPVPSAEPTLVRHGQGYTIYERRVQGLDHELTFLVPSEDPVKIVHLKIANPSDRPRKLSVTFFAEWVLGTTRDQAPMQVITTLDSDSGALMAHNPFHPDFSTHFAFVDVGRRPRTFTADRTEFLGRNGSAAEPAALGRVGLGGGYGAAHDPCAAVQVKLELPAYADEEVTFVIGQAATVEEARRVATEHRDSARFAATFHEVKSRWDQILGAVQVKTPDAGMDLVLNRWLLYQALSCRFWGRSATYQSGGAYGFRDQLQDSMALVYGAPAEARGQLLRAAARQFLEGDVQHWWHPPAGKGVRTRICDDLIFLPYVACHYVTTTGDVSILDEVIPFLDAPLLKPGQEDDYGLPATSKTTGTLYEHCTRALDHAQQLGVNGLSLMGTGDWNDGMNRVGSEGKGESVWNSWFLIAALREFAGVAELRGDLERAGTCRDRAEALRAAIEKNAWDGQWYRRAYFDDGAVLGSSSNEECQIDSIAQSWAAISGVADPDRARMALASVDDQLVHDKDGLILLFTPPFDKGKLQPGYIKGYVPGVRENGGQYTHAATWVALAAAVQGRGQRAFELFDILNPVKHATDPESVNRYKVEPYVVAADIYGRPPHTGRGGWTWYTGSASWLFRVGLEAILGFHLRGDHLTIDPRIPGSWPGFEIAYRYRSSRYRIVVENPGGVEHGVASATLDGQAVDPGSVALADDGRDHELLVRMGAKGSNVA
jgi:cyclic beta-1,2-glucan synthetase